MKTTTKKIKIEREWLGTTIPTSLEMVLKGLDNPEWYSETFGLEPKAALKNIIECLRQQARV